MNIKKCLLLLIFTLSGIFAQDDSIYVTIQGDTATIWHTQTHRNCGSQFRMDVDISDHQLTVTEVDTGLLAFCMCYFDLSVTIGPLDPGDYTVDIYSTDSLNGSYWGSTSFTIGGVALVDTTISDCLIGRDDSSSVSVFISGDTLNLNWDNALLNCCPLLWWQSWLETDTFHVTVTDTGMLCNCSCHFNLTAAFSPFEPGTYILDFQDGEYGYFNFTIGGGSRRDSIGVLDQHQSDCYTSYFNGPPWYVSMEGDDDTGTGSIDEPFFTIQYAINIAGSDDTIFVEPGTYEENIDFVGKSLVLQSLEGALVTTLVAHDTGSVVKFVNHEDSNTHLEGFTITGGETFSGAGILISGASPLIANNIITQNQAGSSSGKLIFHVFGALAEFERNIIRERTKAGMAAAKTRGRVGGRPRKMNVKKIAYARALLESEENTVDDICE